MKKPNCKECMWIHICDNNFEKCRYLQTHCYWCDAPIYEESAFKVKFFWNQGWTGYPICEKCSEGLKTDGKPPMEVLRKSIGLEVEKKITLEKWL